MKKLIAIVAAAAAIGTLTLGASAFNASDAIPSESGKEATIFVYVADASETDPAAEINVAVSGGAAVASVKGGAGVLADYNAGKIAVVGTGLTPGDVLVTIQLTVTGASYTVTLSGDVNQVISSGAGTVVPDTTAPSVSQPDDVTTAPPTSGGSQKPNPDTGIVLALVPAAVAGAALIAAKGTKKR